MFSGKLPPAAAPSAGPNDADLGADRLTERPGAPQVHHGHATSHSSVRGRAAHTHGHGHSQTDRVIATVARNIVVSSTDDGETDEVLVDDTVVFVTAASDADGSDDGDPSGRDDGALRAGELDAPALEADGRAIDAAPAEGPSTTEPTEHIEAAERGIDGVESASAVEAAPATESAGAVNAEGGGGGGGGAAGSAHAPTLEAVPVAHAAVSLAAPVQATAPIERIRPPQAPHRGAARPEQSRVQIIGAGVIVAVVVLVVVLLLGRNSPANTDARDDEQAESERAR